MISQEEHHRAELLNLQLLFHEQKILLAKTVADACSQRASFDARLAKAAADASAQQVSFDSRMAQLLLDADIMKEAHERLSNDRTFQREAEMAAAAAKVRA